MSINYNAQPHAVDVPVTDMDDPEDDIILPNKLLHNRIEHEVRFR